MRRLILTAMIAGLLAPAGLHAQQVYKQGSKVILDLTEDAGMPAGAITTVSKTDVYYYATPNCDIDITYIITDNGTNGTLNTQVYCKLEIAPGDMDSSGTIGSSATMQWVPAFNACIGSTYDGGRWRLPTQRELMLMYIFKPALEALGVAAFSTSDTNRYWSATENDWGSSCDVSFGTGLTSSDDKRNPGYVRCVREL